MTSRNIGTVLAALLLAVGIHMQGLRGWRRRRCWRGRGRGRSGCRQYRYQGPALVQESLALGDQIRGPLARTLINTAESDRRDRIQRLTRTTPHGTRCGTSRQRKEFIGYRECLRPECWPKLGGPKMRRKNTAGVGDFSGMLVGSSAATDPRTQPMAISCVHAQPGVGAARRRIKPLFPYHSLVGIACSVLAIPVAGEVSE